MALELWMQGGGHWFIDTDLGELMVGQAEEMSDGMWCVEVNDGVMCAPDLEAAKRLFVENYDQAQAMAQLGPGSGPGGGSDREDFTIVALPRAEAIAAQLQIGVASVYRVLRQPAA